MKNYMNELIERLNTLRKISQKRTLTVAEREYKDALLIQIENLKKK